MKPLIFLLLIAINVSCQENKNNTPAILVSADSMNAILKNNPGVLLDVRTPEEFADGHLSGAINIDFRNPDFEKGIDSLKKDVTYEVYCRSGKRSSEAVEMMSKKGFKKIYHLEGGILSWKEKGYETVK